ncbi:MAG: LppP/LprE family lipoprotein [Alicyclobacillus sp.]|nr:LppP/LprE family lipoprotein [Alicyclobacillus sp.]
MFLPLQTVVEAIEASGFHVTFDGALLLINNLAFQSRALLLPQQKDQINIVDDTWDQPNVPLITVKVGSSRQTFIPVSAVVQALTQGDSGTFVTWKAGRLSITNDTMGAPSTWYIEQIMASTRESGDSKEHFALTGKPVTITLGNGDTVTACIGTRAPSADGYGQAVFFFHNQQFIGVDSQVEKAQIQSLKASKSGLEFEVTYANYAKDDPMVDPSLPPATITFEWDGSHFVPRDKEKIPSGASNGIRFTPASIPSAAVIAASSRSTPATPQTSPFSINAVPMAVQQVFAKALKAKGKLLNLPGQQSPYLPVDLNGDGNMSYAAAYKAAHGRVGLMVVGLSMMDGVPNGWKVMFNVVSDGAQLQELNAGNMVGDGSNEIAFQSYVGDGANDVYILKDIDGTVKPILHVTGAADIGDYNGLGQMEAAVWLHDTGPMEKIQLYAWNSTKHAYQPANSLAFPRYFGRVVWNYDQQAFQSGPAKGDLSKMADAMWASTYLNMGNYMKAIAAAKAGLRVKHAATAYPPNSVLKSILRQATIRESEVLTYIHLPSKIKHSIDTMILKHSGFYDPLGSSIPLVSKIGDGTYAVSVIGEFNQMRGSVYETGTELTFKVRVNGSTVGPVVMRDPFGVAVH